jgi:L-2,4-diaminobutyric acid acetyltransferase
MDQLARDCPPLDTNSRYLYLLMCHHHASTCAAARDDEGRLVGMVTAYKPPAEPRTLFIWQMAVAPQGRGQSLARKMIQAILRRPSNGDVDTLEATVSPSNTASRRVFESLARHLNTTLRVDSLFESEHFGGADHEPENKFHLGPFKL